MTQYWNLNTGMSTTCLGYWILIDGEIKKSVTLLSGFIALHCCLPPTRQRGTVVVPQCWQVGSNNCTNSDHGYKDAIIIYLFLYHLLWGNSFETFGTFLIYFNTEVILYHGVISWPWRRNGGNQTSHGVMCPLGQTWTKHERSCSVGNMIMWFLVISTFFTTQKNRNIIIVLGQQSNNNNITLLFLQQSRWK